MLNRANRIRIFFNGIEETEWNVNFHCLSQFQYDANRSIRISESTILCLRISLLPINPFVFLCANPMHTSTHANTSISKCPISIESIAHLMSTFDVYLYRNSKPVSFDIFAYFYMYIYLRLHVYTSVTSTRLHIAATRVHTPYCAECRRAKNRCVYRRVVSSSMCRCRQIYLIRDTYQWTSACAHASIHRRCLCVCMCGMCWLWSTYVKQNERTNTPTVFRCRCIRCTPLCGVGVGTKRKQ